MLPPHLHGVVCRPRSMSTSVLHSSTSTLTRSGTRSLWWKRPCDYTSQVDPMYHRMSRYRTLKTRAKMLDKLRRRGKFDWDVMQRPFFTPRQTRWASHVGKPKWSPSPEQDQKPRPQEADPEDGFELSQREKEWKDHMEALRKRINQDPYEAVFGRRFEPFWTPLVPQWMKEEIGLQSKDPSEAKATNNNSNSSTSRSQAEETAKAAYRPLEPEPIQTKRQVHPSIGAYDDQSAPARYTYDPKKTSVDVNSDSPNGQQTSYSYGATTTWDSWTKKASRVEWDSASGEKRRYEYDPISNRMVQVKGPPESEVKKVEDALKDYPARSESPLMSHGWQSGLGNKTSISSSIDIPVKTTKNTRQAISVPTQDSNGQKTSVYFPSLINTSVVADTPKPSSLTKHERFPDTLTASDIRASVGQNRAERVPPPTRDEERAYRHGKPDPRKLSQWEQAEHRVMLNEQLYDITKQKQKLLKQESTSFHIEKIQREMSKLELRASDLHKQLDAMDNVPSKPVAIEPEPERNSTITAKLYNTSTQPPAKLQPAMERIQSKTTLIPEDPDDSAAHESTGDFGGYSFNDIPKVSSVVSRPTNRIQQKARLSREDIAQAENDALRKSGTSMVERLREKRSLEDRVQSEVLGRKSTPRWIDVMNARKAAEDARKSNEQIAIETRDAAKNERLAKANALLQAEIDEQKNRMSAHEHRHPAVVENTQQRHTRTATVSSPADSQRYQDKIRDLRKELDIAYKQSSSNAEGHVDTIRKLEKKLQTSLEGRSDVSDAEKKKYIKKIKTLREELDEAFRQSSINAEMQVDRIRELERELESARKGSKPTELLQAEGDMSANVTKFAKDSSKWYKQQAQVYAKDLPEVEAQLKSSNKARDEALTEHELRAGSAYELQASRRKQEALEDSKAAELHPIDQALAEYERRAAQRKSDQALVNEVRDIYENKYGTIYVDHRQSSVDEALQEHEQRKKLPPSLDEALRAHEQRAPLQPSVDKALEEYKMLPPSVDKALKEHELKSKPQPSVDKALEQHERKMELKPKATPEVFAAQDDYQEQASSVDRALEEHEVKQKRKAANAELNDWFSEVDPEQTRRLENEKRTREAEIAQQEKEAHEAQSAMDKEVYGTRSVDKNVQHPIKSASKHSIEWQEPPVYKVLAYDSGNDFLVTSTTSTNFTGKETPISIPEALSQLYQPARFIPEFAQLQKQNFQVIHGTRDLLVLRKAKTSAAAAEETTLQDHGLITPSPEPTSATLAPKVNPVDKTGFQEPATGSFASPTGFVGDRVWDVSTDSPETQTVNSALEEYEVKHYPRVTRQEHVFSGSRLGNRGSSSSSSQSSNKKKEEKEQRRKYRGWRRSAKWALISGVGVGVAAYSIGAAAERSRERDMERWQKILKEQRDMGGLGADGKRLRDGGSGVFWR